MRTIFLIPALLCLALAAQACHDSSLFPFEPTKDPKPIDSIITRLTLDQVIGEQWQLQSYGTVGGVPTPIPATENLTLTLSSQNRLGGIADCNSYGADYVAGANNSLSITNMGQTKAYCGNDKFDVEYLTALREASVWEATPGALRIYYRGGSMVLNYMKTGTIRPTGGGEKRMPITDMLGVTWKLSSLETLGTTVAPGQVTLLTGEENYTLIVTTAYANHIEGIANCNTYNGQFTGSDSAFRVFGFNATKVYCPEDHDLDAAYFTAMQGAEKGVITTSARGTTLEISYDNGRKILHYNLADDQAGDSTVMPLLSEAFGVKWELSAIGLNGGPLEPPKRSAPDNVPWVEFFQDGTMSGIGYCSPYSGFFQADASLGLSISNFTWPSATICQFDEYPIFNALMTAVSYTLTNYELTITSANNTVMVFTRK